MRPLLSAKIKTETDFQSIKYPVYGSPKYDGIRVLITPQGAVCRSLKPVPNWHIHKVLSVPELIGADGEVLVGPLSAPNVFNVTTSSVMSMAGEPEFTYAVFDCMENPKLPFVERYEDAAQKYRRHANVLVVPQVVLENRDELGEFEEKMVSEGYEGIMVRSLEGTYKFGRATLREGILSAVKRFVDSEAEVIGFEELEINDNEPTTNLLGYQVRSSAKSGKRPAGTLGKLCVRDLTHGWEFSIGSGFTDALRKWIWNNQNTALGTIVNYKFQQHGMLNVPRLPIFRGFRDRRDM